MLVNLTNIGAEVLPTQEAAKKEKEKKNRNFANFSQISESVNHFGL